MTREEREHREPPDHGVPLSTGRRAGQPLPVRPRTPRVDPAKGRPSSTRCRCSDVGATRPVASHNWLLLYRKHGRAGLAPGARRDAGRSRTMSETEAAVLLLYLENHPELTAAAALRTLQADGRISS